MFESEQGEPNALFIQQLAKAWLVSVNNANHLCAELELDPVVGVRSTNEHSIAGGCHRGLRIFSTVFDCSCSNGEVCLNQMNQERADHKPSSTRLYLTQVRQKGRRRERERAGERQIDCSA